MTTNENKGAATSALALFHDAAIKLVNANTAFTAAREAAVSQTNRVCYIAAHVAAYGTAEEVERIRDWIRRPSKKGDDLGGPFSSIYAPVHKALWLGEYVRKGGVIRLKDYPAIDRAFFAAMEPKAGLPSLQRVVDKFRAFQREQREQREQNWAVQVEAMAAYLATDDGKALAEAWAAPTAEELMDAMLKSGAAVEMTAAVAKGRELLQEAAAREAAAREEAEFAGMVERVIDHVGDIPEELFTRLAAAVQRRIKAQDKARKSA